MIANSARYFIMVLGFSPLSLPEGKAGSFERLTE